MSKKVEKKSISLPAKAVQTTAKKPAAKKPSPKTASKQSSKVKKGKKGDTYANPTTHYTAGDFTISAKSKPEDVDTHLTDIQSAPAQDFRSHINPDAQTSVPAEDLRLTQTDAQNLQYTYEKEEGYLENIANAEKEIVDSLAKSGEHRRMVPALSPADILISEVLKDDAVTPAAIAPDAPYIEPQKSTASPAHEDTTAKAKEKIPLGVSDGAKEQATPVDGSAQQATPIKHSSSEEASKQPSTTEEILSTPPPTSIVQSIKTFCTHPSVLMVLSAFLFSSMILFVKLASVYYTSFEIISFRGLIGVLCILGFQFFRHGVSGIRSLRTKYLGMQVWRAFVGTASMLCWFYGVSKLTLAMSTTLNYMSSIWMAIFIISTAFITGKTSPSLKLLGSVLVGFAGIVIVLRPSGADVDMFAAAVVIIASVFGALAYLQVAALGKMGEPAYRTVFYFSAFGAIFGLIATFVYQGALSEFSWMGLLLLLPIGILAMVAQFCLTLAYTGGNALVNASLQYTGLIFVVFFDWLLGAGWPDYIAWMGMALVVSSGLLATIARSRQKVKA